MSGDIYRWYKPRRGFRQTALFLAVFSVFPAGGTALLAAGLAAPGAVLLALGLGFYALILSQAAATGRRYGIGEDTVILKRPASEKVIRFDELESAAILNRLESRRFLEELYSTSVESERSLDLGSWLRSNRRTADITAYLSVPVTGTETRSGHSTNITSHSVKTSSEMLLLRTVGQLLLISPDDTAGFHRSLLEKGVSDLPVVKGEGRLSGIEPTSFQ